MTFDLAVEAMARNVPKTWRVEPFRRHAVLVDETNSKRSLPLLSLASTGIIAPRKEEGGMGKQAPSESTIERYWIARPGNLVVNPMWLIGGGIGVSTVSGAVSPDYRVYRLGPDLHPQYVHHLLRSAPYRDQYRLYTRADTTFDRRVSKENFHPMPLLVPPLDEQRRIAEFLDAEIARIDALTSLKVRQQYVLEERFETELVHTLLPSATPPGWQSTRLKYLFDDVRNGVWGEEPTGDGSDVHCVRVADFERFSLRSASDAPTLRQVPASMLRGRILNPGDVLLEKSGGGEKSPVGFAVTFNSTQRSICSNFVAVMRPASTTSPRYAGLLMAAMYKAGRNTPFVKQTTGIQNLDGEGYLAQQVSVPGHLQQEELSRRLDHNLDESNRIRGHLRSQTRLLQERRQALITAAVTGQFDVTTASGRNVTDGVTA